MTEYFGFKETMQYLGIKSHKTLNYYIQQGLPVTKIGKSKRISKTAIDEFMKAHTVVTKGEVTNEKTI
ncbi:helix-turn-helix domain-containing protein [Lactobacillus johnsonii]|uniref:helix-turn-helix domain-containing protein n=1 Tax=Lactobacillus johnsonii TaxID=33959 RepID=UPI003D77FF97